MKQNSKKNATGKFFGKNILPIVAFACLFAIAFTSCEDDDDAVDNYSKMSVGNIDYTYPVPSEELGNGKCRAIGTLYGNNLALNVCGFYVFDKKFNSLDVSSSVLNDTVKILLQPKDYIPESMMEGWWPVKFSCIIYNVPLNRDFYVVISDGGSSVFRISF